MENAIGCIVGNAYTSMLSSTGRHLSSAIWGKVSCFVAGAVAGAGVTYCVIKGKEIREKLLTLMVVDLKISKTSFWIIFLIKVGSMQGIYIK